MFGKNGRHKQNREGYFIPFGISTKENAFNT
jgi:hypothetical protein